MWLKALLNSATNEKKTPKGVFNIHCCLQQPQEKSLVVIFSLQKTNVKLIKHYLHDSMRSFVVGTI